MTRLDEATEANWEIHLRDPWGRPAEAIGGVTGPIWSADGALSAFFSVHPDLSRYPLIAVRTPLAGTEPARRDG